MSDINLQVVDPCSIYDELIKVATRMLKSLRPGALLYCWRDRTADDSTVAVDLADSDFVHEPMIYLGDCCALIHSKVVTNITSFGWHVITNGDIK